MSPLLTIGVLAVSALIGHQVFSVLNNLVTRFRTCVFVLLGSLVLIGLVVLLMYLEVLVFAGFLALWILVIVAWCALIFALSGLLPSAVFNKDWFHRVLWCVAVLLWPVGLFLYLFIRDNVVT